MLVNSGQIHTIRDVISAPPSSAAARPAGPAVSQRSSQSAPLKWYYTPDNPMSARLLEFVQQSSQAVHGGYVNHPMHCFFLAHCLVELQKFGSHALAVVQTLYSAAGVSESSVYCPFSRSPAVLVQEALALYSIRDYDGSQVR